MLENKRTVLLIPRRWRRCCFQPCGPGVRISELQAKGRDIYRREGVPDPHTADCKRSAGNQAQPYPFHLATTPDQLSRAQHLA